VVIRCGGGGVETVAGGVEYAGYLGRSAAGIVTPPGGGQDELGHELGAYGGGGVE